MIQNKYLWVWDILGPRRVKQDLYLQQLYIL